MTYIDKGSIAATNGQIWVRVGRLTASLRSRDDLLDEAKASSPCVITARKAVFILCSDTQ